MSWFRILVKWVHGLGEKDYCWHEMTFFVHQPDKGFLTVVMFDVPEHENTKPSDVQNNQNGTANPSQPKQTLVKAMTSHIHRSKIPANREVEPFHFLGPLCEELCRHSVDQIDQKLVQAILLRQVMIVVDRAVWACSNAVRYLEKVCMIFGSSAAFSLSQTKHMYVLPALLYANHYARTDLTQRK